MSSEARPPEAFRLRLLSDENFNDKIVLGVLRRVPDLDVIRVADVALCGASDEEILEWAAANERILLTHDCSTIPPTAYQRIAERKPMPGVIVIASGGPIGAAVEQILLLATASMEGEWDGQVLYR